MRAQRRLLEPGRKRQGWNATISQWCTRRTQGERRADAPCVLSKLSSNLPCASNRVAPPLFSMKGLGKELEWGHSRLGGEVAHTQMRANNRVWICLEGVTTLNKCTLEEGAAARERALRRMTAVKPSYGISPQFYEPFTTFCNDNCVPRSGYFRNGLKLENGPHVGMDFSKLDTFLCLYFGYWKDGSEGKRELSAERRSV